MTRDLHTASLEEHQQEIEKRRQGKPTEGVLMRFNERELYLLDLASRLASKKGFSSRHAWMRHVLLESAQNEIQEHPELAALSGKAKEPCR